MADAASREAQELFDIIDEMVSLVSNPNADHGTILRGESNERFRQLDFQIGSECANLKISFPEFFDKTIDSEIYFGFVQIPSLKPREDTLIAFATPNWRHAMKALKFRIEKAFSDDPMASNKSQVSLLSAAKATINSRMLDILGKKNESKDWTLRKWAEALSCSPSGVKKTKAWKMIMQDRAGQKEQQKQRSKRQYE